MNAVNTNLFAQVLADPQVGLQKTEKAIESHGRLIALLPNILANRLHDRVSTQSLMRAQHQVLQYLLAGTEETDWLVGLSHTVANWSTADASLDLVGMTAEDFFRRSYLGEDEIQRIEHGALSIGELLQKKPQAFIAPMLRRIKHTRH